MRTPVPARLTKTLSLSEAAARIPDGATLALGGIADATTGVQA